MEIEQGMFTPLVFKTTGGIADEYVKYHSRLEELIANKKGETYNCAIAIAIVQKCNFLEKSLKYLSPSYALQYYAWEAQDPEEDS